MTVKIRWLFILQGNITFISSCTTQIIHWEIILYTVLMYSPILATETHSKCLDLKRLLIMCKQSFMRKACSWERPNGINCKENIHVSLNLEVRVHCTLRNGTQRWEELRCRSVLHCTFRVQCCTSVLLVLARKVLWLSDHNKINIIVRVIIYNK